MRSAFGPWPPALAALFLGAAGFFWLLKLQAQTPAADPPRIELQMPVGGPLPPAASVAITASGDWTIAADPDIFSVRPTQGTGNATVTIAPVDWKPVGNYSTDIKISSQGGSRTIPASLAVLERTSPKFTYIQGPTGCQDANPGLPPRNAAVCTPPPLNPPANGTSYRDPNFGASVRPVANGYHGYSTPSPVSASNKYALVALDGENPAVVDLATGKTVRPSPIGFEGVMWDGHNDNYLYGFAGNTLRRYDVGSGRTSTVANYSRNPLRFASIGNGGTGEMTRDNWLAFFARQERQICALDLNASATYCGAIPNGTEVDFPTMSKGVDKVSGQRYVIGVASSGPFLLYAVNAAQNRLDLIGRGPENVMMLGGNRDGICDAGEPCFNGSHADTTEDEAGNQYLIFGAEAQHPCEFSLVSLQLNKGDRMGLAVETGGGLKRVMTLFRCGGDKWTDFHMGCAKSAPACVLSIAAQGFGETRQPGNSAPPPPSPYLGEILVIQNNGAEIRRLATHRSISFSNEEANGYWSTPRAAISSDAAYVVATSNFGIPNKRRVVAIETGIP